MRSHLFPLLIPILMFCSVAVTGCASRVEHKVIAPPPALLAPCQRPSMPEALLHGNDIKDYAVASTRYIIDLEEQLDVCNGKINAISEFYAEQKAVKK